MMRQWQTPLPEPIYPHGRLWVDWVMPWVIVAIASMGLTWVMAQVMPYIPVLEPTGAVDTTPGVQLGHPSLDRAWDEWRKSGQVAPPAPPNDDY